MTTPRTTLVAMSVAALMIAHQIAAKAVREATFLGAWPVSAVPAMMIGAAVTVVALAPVYSRLLARLGAYRVVSAGFLLSAVAHLLEWQAPARHPGVAVLVYLHVAGFGGLLLSGFWSAASELFDPQTARRSYGRIGAAGTTGGILGGLAVARLAATAQDSAALLLLAALHAACAAGAIFLRPTHAVRPTSPPPDPVRSWWFDRRLLSRLPHLKTLGLIVMLGTSSAAIADYLLKVRAVEAFGTGTPLLGFFATFYLVVQVLTVLAQLLVGASLRRRGLGRTMSALPAGVTVGGTLAILYPIFPVFVLLRGLESVLRGSLFRGAYELIFVPMAPDEKARSKTLLDVTCDRLGDAVGAGVVQLALLTGAAFVSAELLAVMVALSVAHLWLAGRLDGLYLRVVERRLRAHPDQAPIVVGSETGWTVLNLPTLDTPERGQAGDPPRIARTFTEQDPALRRLGDLRSGDRTRVERTLDQLSRPNASEVAQVVQLLAWDDVVPRARAVLERVAPAHLGLLTDALIDQETDFAIRRRVPRIVGAVPDPRAVVGLVRGLEDARFEVRYQCGRALRRLLSRHPSLAVDQAHIWAVVERELSAPLAVWRGHRLIDHVDGEDEAAAFGVSRGRRNVEHVFNLLALMIPAEPLAVALQGLEHEDPALKGVAVEYLAGVLPASVWTELRPRLEGQQAAPTDPVGTAPAE